MLTQLYEHTNLLTPHNVDSLKFTVFENTRLITRNLSRNITKDFFYYIYAYILSLNTLMFMNFLLIKEFIHINS